MPPNIFLAYWIFTAFCFAWVAVFAVIAWCRYKREGHPLPELKKAEKLFEERGASGKSSKRWAGASRILIVAVTNENLLICPYLLWAIFEPYWKFDMIHRIPISKIRCVESGRGFLMSGGTVVIFVNPKDEEQSFKLLLRDAEGFKKALVAAGLSPDAIA